MFERVDINESDPICSQIITRYTGFPCLVLNSAAGIADMCNLVMCC